MKAFAPIAIVGQAALLPGAPDAKTFADNVFNSRDAVTEAKDGRFGVPHASVVGTAKAWHDRMWSTAGGYVDGFEKQWDPSGFAISAAELEGLDPLVLWLLHTGREALRSASLDKLGMSGHKPGTSGKKIGAIFGNLSFPSEGMARWGEATLLQQAGYPLPPGKRPDPRNHFMSGLPADLLARGLGLDAGAFALDAACASSLYAIKYACDALTAGRADVMLAGAVNRADSLFIHIGFCALGAMSKTGQSRPFHAGADGLVPAEGAAFVCLKRLADAERDGDRILGVIRGIGLANDARARSLLAPSEEGQERALRLAYAQAGLSPSDIQLVECHATGTPTGDRTEIASMSRVFGTPASKIPIGSLKSMLGHLITVAGVAGLLKVLAGFERKLLPPTLHADTPLPELERSPFRLVRSPEPWDAPQRRAAVSAFGFGGNNAHLIVEEHRKGQSFPVAAQESAAPIAIVGIAVSAGSCGDRLAFAGAALEGKPATPTTGDVTLSLDGLRFPPNDLRCSLPQQTLLFQVALQAAAEAGTLPRDRTSMLVGMGCDGAVTGYGLRWRLPTHMSSWAISAPEGQALLDASAPSLRAEHVVGTMPNIPANRLNFQLDLGGPSFTVAHEELSGIAALSLALRALRNDEIDAALVGAVEIAEPRLDAALRALGRTAGASDAAVVLVLKRLDDATRDGNKIFAILDDVRTGLQQADAPAAGVSSLSAPASLGQAHAASGLLDVAAATLACATGKATRAQVSAKSLGGSHATVTLRSSGAPFTLDAGPVVRGPSISLPGHVPTGLPRAARPAPTEPPMTQSRDPKSPQVMARAPQLKATDWTPGRDRAADSRRLYPEASHRLRAEAPTARTAPASPTRIEPPAPVATPVAPPAPAFVPEIVAAPRAPVFAPAPMSAPVSMGTSSSDPLIDAILQNQRQVAEVHRAFLERASAVHRTFLASRALPGAPQQTEPLPPAPTPALTNGKSTHQAAASSIVAQQPMPQLQAPRPAAAIAKAGPAPAAPPPLVARPLVELPGPKLSRAQLERGASGSIAEIFGPAFAELDQYQRLVRMPEPPLLLADRVLGIAGPAKVLGKGTIWTETDIKEDSWYLHDGHIPPGIMIEAGQADLLLASWQGIDFTNKSERIYRLLGCDLRYTGGLPKPGDTLQYEINVDGHANLGDVRMFFFHYDCAVRGQKRLSVSGGQAGFFTDKELLDSGGVLWDAATAEIDLKGPLAKPIATPTRKDFSKQDLIALSEGKIAETFGETFFRAYSHTRTPSIAKDRLILMDRVHVDLEGGPWKRGYLKAELDINPDLWFFKGHFKNDPCMPGTLMFDGCLQAMQLYLTAMGYTLDRDGWRFEPAPDETFKLRCRGQVIPTSKKLTYELFVQEITDGPRPRLKAQILCTVDGLKCFHADPLIVEMVPDWPLSRMTHLYKDHVETKKVEWDYASLLACAYGQPSHAFGKMYEVFDNHRKVARLPGPPYHFISRVLGTTGDMGKFKAGCTVDVEYDVPPDAWYFADNGGRTMPWAVLLEAALQPCGWLASWSGCALTVPNDLLFRNLDGTATIHEEILPTTGTLRTKVRCNRIDRSAGMIIVDFSLDMFVGDRKVLDMNTVFGFFPPEAFLNQAGVGSTAPEKAWLVEKNDFLHDLLKDPLPPIGHDKLKMLDRVTGHWPTGGAKGLGRWRGEKDVDPKEWMFKAHFFSDPVQPGSLGLETLVQLLQYAMLHEGYAKNLKRARFEPLAVGLKTTWKYRGQVTPKNKLVHCELEITARTADTMTCDAHLWVDGKRIYTCKGLAMRIVEGANDPEPPPAKRLEKPATPSAQGGTTSVVTVAVPTDHRPTYVLPSLPMMTMARLAVAAGGREALKDAVAVRWFTFPDGPRSALVNVDGDKVTISTVKDEQSKAPSEVVFTARLADPEPPTTPVALQNGKPGLSGAALYASGQLFHGPAFHVVERIEAMGFNGATAILRPAAPDILLDGATHAIPHDRLEQWCPDIAPGQVAYPSRLRSLSLYGAPPTTEVRCEVRFLGMADKRRPLFSAHLYEGARLCAQFTLEEILLPKGRLGSALPHDRRTFLQGGAVPGLSLARLDGDTATLGAMEAAASDWLPGTLARVYGSAEAPVIAAKELEAARLQLHPRQVGVTRTATGLAAFDRRRPLTRRLLTIEKDQVKGGELRSPDLALVSDWWRAFLKCGEWPGEELLLGLTRSFLGDFVLHDPDGLEALHGKPVLYLGNHETYVESVIFSAVMSAVSGIKLNSVAKTEHQQGWLGELHALLTEWPGVPFPACILYFNQQNPAELPALVKGQCVDQSLLVHVEGTRQTVTGQQVEKISSLWVDVAVERKIPIVPVAFRRGVAGEKVDFPVGPQDHHVGRPILPEELAALPYAERRKRVVDAINALPSRPPAQTVAPGAAAALRSALQGTLLERRLTAGGSGAEGAWLSRLAALLR